jgi:hydrogenase-4 component B
MSPLLPIDTLLIAACAWLAIGLAGLVAPRNMRFVSKTLFPLGALVGVIVGLVALGSLGGPAQTAVLVIGLPDLPFHLRLDNLSAVFALLLGFVAAGISIFAAGYFRKGEGTAPGLMCLQYHFFLASMLMVLLADDAYAFMVAWETMALSSFFLVTTDHRHEEIRRAGFLYLLIAHIGAIAILLCFGVMTGGAGDYSFAGMRAQELSPFWASAAFLLALAGFGAKAGLVPLHVWLPEAHPAAPSPVSAMMSGVMLKTAIYGLLRVSFDLLHSTLWWWGRRGAGDRPRHGAVRRALQHGAKRHEAAAGVFVDREHRPDRRRHRPDPDLSRLPYGNAGGAGDDGRALSLLAHSAFKSLLFLCTGSVLHATKERSLGKLGGLIHRMPWVAWLALAG